MAFYKIKSNCFIYYKRRDFGLSNARQTCIDFQAAPKVQTAMIGRDDSRQTIQTKFYSFPRDSFHCGHPNNQMRIPSLHEKLRLIKSLLSLLLFGSVIMRERNENCTDLLPLLGSQSGQNTTTTTSKDYSTYTCKL